MNESLNELLCSIKQRVRAENDIVMAVSGPEGSGKSTLAIKLGMALDDAYSQDNLKWIDQNIMVNPDVELLQNKILKDLPPHSYVCVDEGMRVVYKRDFGSFENKFLAKLFSVSRKCKKIVSICIPNFRDLDSYYRNHRIKLWWYVPERGRAMVFKPSPSPFCDDPWNIQENEKLFRKALGRKAYADFGTEEVIQGLRKTKNYVMDFSFSRMPQEIEARYLHNVEALRKEMDYKKEKERTEKAKKNKYRELYYGMRGNFAKLARFVSKERILSYRDTGGIIEKEHQYVEHVITNDWEYQQKLGRKEKVNALKDM